MNDRRKAQLIWHHSQQYRQHFVIAVMAMALGYVCLFGVPLIMKYAIDLLGGTTDTQPAWFSGSAAMISNLRGQDTNTLDYLLGGAGLMLGLTLLAGLCIYTRDRLVAVASEGIVENLRNGVYDHLAHLPSRFHDQADTGDLVQRCTSDIETVRVFLASQVVEIGRAVLMLIVVLPILFSLHPGMAWWSLVTLPLLCWFAVLFFGRVKTLFLTVDEAEAHMTTVLQENLTGIRVVRAFARQDFEIAKFGKTNAAFRNENTRLIRLLAVYYGASDLICLFQIGLLLMIGAVWVHAGTLTVGTLFAFITFEGMIIFPIRHLGRVLTDCGKAIVAMGRLSEVLDETTESDHETAPATPLQGEITFDAVSFAYDPGKPVLQDLSFTLPAGQTLALLGAPGAGKSTVAQLLLRLYDHQKGLIRLDGQDLIQLPRKYVRRQISIVLQEPFLYGTTLGANIRVGNPHASVADVEAAARDACIHESISGLKDGYATRVGERGATLSGGQRQRVALARALLKNPPVLILDDALSAVDTDTEGKILAALKTRRAGQTTLIIAHRLSTIMHADQIVVIEHGTAVQCGTHDQLSREPGTYKRLCELQGAIQQVIDGDIARLADANPVSHS